MTCGRITPRAAPAMTKRAGQKNMTSPGSSRSTHALPSCSRSAWSKGTSRRSAPGATTPGR
eukprot:3507324-Lingulodinium_polyedra.AAC.1